jgi:thioredoxin 1
MSKLTLILTKENFYAEIAEGIVLVDFWAEWCGPCMAMGPVMDELAEEFTNRVKVGKLNIDEDSEIAEKFEITSIPSFKIFKNGKEVASFVGAIGKDKIKEELEKTLDKS